jgi:hypothetical protein
LGLGDLLEKDKMRNMELFINGMLANEGSEASMEEDELTQAEIDELTSSVNSTA